MSFTATTYILPYVGTDRVIKIQTSTSVKVGGFNVCQYIKSATEEKELIIFTSLGQIVLDFPTEGDAKLAQNLLNQAVELLAANCTFVPALSLEYYKESINSPVTPSIILGLSSFAVGEDVTIDLTSDTTYGIGKSLNSTGNTNVLLLGFNLTVSGASDRIIIGQNDFTLDIDDNGWLYSLPTYNTAVNSGTYAFVGIDDNGKLYNTGFTSTSFTSQVGLNQIVFGDNVDGTITSTALFVRDPSTGYIGIGDATPTNPIDVKFTGGSIFASFDFTGTDNGILINATNNTTLALREGGVNEYIIKTSGGATYIDTKGDYLLRSATANPLHAIQSVNGTPDHILYGNVYFQFSATNNGIFTSTGKLGVGTINFDDLFGITGAARFVTQEGINRFSHTGSSFGIENGTVILFNQIGVSTATIGTFSNHNLIIRTNNTDKVTITTAGQVSFGDPSAPSNQFLDFKGAVFFKLNVNTTSSLSYNSSGELFLTGINGNGAANMQFTSIAAKTQNLIRGSAGQRLAFATVGSADMQMSTAGNLFIGLDGITGVDAAARLEIKGVDATSANYGLMVNDSASANLFTVRNDGLINIGDLAGVGQRYVTVSAGGNLAAGATVAGMPASKYSESGTALTANVTYTVTHNLGTDAIAVTVWDTSTDEQLIGFTANNRTANSFDLTVTATNNYDIIVIG